MRSQKLLLSALLALLPALPALSATSGLTRPIRTGEGQPRTRDVTTGASAAQRTAGKPGVTRAYQAPKPGEGAPKG
jgi:hypothetical protein